MKKKQPLEHYNKLGDLSGIAAQRNRIPASSESKAATNIINEIANREQARKALYRYQLDGRVVFRHFFTMSAPAFDVQFNRLPNIGESFCLGLAL